MTMICGGMLAIGQPHGQRSGIDSPTTVLILRRDKKTAWERASMPRRRKGDEPRPPSALWLDTGTYRDYEYRYALTDALIWWADSGKLGLDTDLVGELRAYGQMGKLVSDEAAAAKLKTARKQVESANLTGTISLFLSLATGDQPLATIPPRSDHLSGLIENLRNLNVQYELSAPIASRLIPGMSQEMVDTTYQPDGAALGLFASEANGTAD